MKSRRLIRWIVAKLLPFGRCAICGSDSSGGPAPGICSTCWRKREKIVDPTCPICGRPLTIADNRDNDVCGTCLAHRPPYAAHTGVYLYSGPVRTLVLLYKEGKRYALASLLAGAVVRRVRSRWPDVEWTEVTFIPGLMRRRLSRGFDPAALIALNVAKRMGLSFSVRLKMKKAVKPQKGLPASKRRENIRGAFALEGPAKRVKGVKLLLVDDVLTTGSTMREGATVLKKAGAEVWAATVAMTPKRELDFADTVDPVEKKGVANG